MIKKKVLISLQSWKSYFNEFSEEYSNGLYATDLVSFLNFSFTKFLHVYKDQNVGCDTSNHCDLHIKYSRILIFMYRTKLIQCKALDFMTDKLTYEDKKVKQACDLIFDSRGLLQAFEQYKMTNQEYEIRNESLTVNCSSTLEIRLTLMITNCVLLSMKKPLSNLPKSKDKILNAIEAMRNSKANSKDLSSEECKILSNNDQLKLWVLRLLEQKNIIQYDNSPSSQLTINKDQMNEYLENLGKNNFEEDDVSKILFPD